MKRFIISGCAGFIGSHPCEKLLENGNGVLFMDNLYNGDKCNMEHIINHHYFE